MVFIQIASIKYKILCWRHPRLIYQFQFGTSNFEYFDKVALDISNLHIEYLPYLKYSLSNKISLEKLVESIEMIK